MKKLIIICLIGLSLLENPVAAMWHGKRRQQADDYADHYSKHKRFKTLSRDLAEFFLVAQNENLPDENRFEKIDEMLAHGYSFNEMNDEKKTFVYALLENFKNSPDFLKRFFEKYDSKINFETKLENTNYLDIGIRSKFDVEILKTLYHKDPDALLRLESRRGHNALKDFVLIYDVNEIEEFFKDTKASQEIEKIKKNKEFGQHLVDNEKIDIIMFFIKNYDFKLADFRPEDTDVTEMNLLSKILFSDFYEDYVKPFREKFGKFTLDKGVVKDLIEKKDKENQFLLDASDLIYRLESIYAGHNRDIYFMPLISAIWSGRGQSVLAYIWPKLERDVNAPFYDDQRQNSYLSLSVRAKSDEAVKFFLKIGAKINPDIPGLESSFKTAAAIGNVSALKIMLERLSSDEERKKLVNAAKNNGLPPAFSALCSYLDSSDSGQRVSHMSLEQLKAIWGVILPYANFDRTVWVGRNCRVDIRTYLRRHSAWLASEKREDLDAFLAKYQSNQKCI